MNPHHCYGDGFSQFAGDRGMTARLTRADIAEDRAKVRQLHHLITSPGGLSDQEIIEEARRIIRA